jgi:hypothetical protein
MAIIKYSHIFSHRNQNQIGLLWVLPVAYIPDSKQYSISLHSFPKNARLGSGYDVKAQPGVFWFSQLCLKEPAEYDLFSNPTAKLLFADNEIFATKS